MTIGSQIAWDDTILPFQLDRSDIRGRVARLDGVLDEVLAQHDYPPAIEALFQATQGMPRKVNRLAHYALTSAAIAKARRSIA